MGAQHDCDVLVVGAGPTGSATALFLAQRGVRVILADREADYYRLHHGGIPRRMEAPMNRHARGGGHVGGVKQILDGNGYAFQRPTLSPGQSFLGQPRLPSRLRRIEPRKGAQAAVHSLDPRQRAFHQLACGNRPRSEHRRDLRQIAIVDRYLRCRGQRRAPTITEIIVVGVSVRLRHA